MNSTDDRTPLKHHYDVKVLVLASIDRVFAYLDEHARLSSHMSKASWMMGGGSMRMHFDEAQGKAVGSRISLTGKIFGMKLAVEEVVTDYGPPVRKTWETIGTPRLLVIAHYRMGFVLEPQGDFAQLNVFIDYALPRQGLARLCGFAFGGIYARWCTQQMAKDAAKHFEA